MSSCAPATTPPPIAFVELPPLATQFVRAPTPSPDGKYLAMIAKDASGKTHLWTRAIADASARSLDSTDGE